MATKNPSKRSLANGYVSKGGYDAFDDQDNYKTMPNYMTSDPKPLHVRVHVNNNTNDKGKDMVIVPKIYKTFDRLLEDVTEKLKPPFGAVRRLYTSRGRNKIQNVNELNDGSIYVATGPEHYKRHNYKDIGERRTKSKPVGLVTYKLVDHALDENYRKKSAECFRLNQQRKGLLLLISVNGKNLEGAHHLSISYHLKNDLDRIKTSIQENLGLRMISRLYKVINYGGRLENFSEITDANDLHRFDHVLAVQIGQKLDVKYYQPERLKDFHMKTSPRSEPIPTPRNLSVFQKYKKLPSIGSSKQSEANTSSPFSNPPGSQGGRKARKSRGAKEVNYDRDDGVYRAKKQNNAYGAHQERVDEDAAAAKIQAGVRGYQARKDYGRKKEAKMREQDDERRWQEDEARRLEEEARQREDDMRRQEEEGRDREMMAQRKQMDEDEAATRIQASFKGHRARKDFRAKKTTGSAVSEH